MYKYKGPKKTYLHCKNSAGTVLKKHDVQAAANIKIKCLRQMIHLFTENQIFCLHVFLVELLFLVKHLNLRTCQKEETAKMNKRDFLGTSAPSRVTTSCFSCLTDLACVCQHE